MAERRGEAERQMAGHSIGAGGDVGEDADAPAVDEAALKERRRQEREAEQEARREAAAYKGSTV